MRHESAHSVSTPCQKREVIVSKAAGRSPGPYRQALSTLALSGNACAAATLRTSSDMARAASAGPAALGASRLAGAWSVLSKVLINCFQNTHHHYPAPGASECKQPVQLTSANPANTKAGRQQAAAVRTRRISCPPHNTTQHKLQVQQRTSSLPSTRRISWATSWGLSRSTEGLGDSMPHKRRASASPRLQINGSGVGCVSKRKRGGAASPN